MPRRVIVVDDSPDIHDLVQIGLIGEPIALEGCYDGATALAAARRELPDLLLLDVDMPGTDGFEVCRLLKADAALAHVPVVFLTGASSTEEKLRGLELGAIDYVTKPFDPVELRARVRAALRTKELMDQLAREAANLRAHGEVLRMVAQDAPLAGVQGRLITLAEAEYPGSAAAIVLLQRGQLTLVAPRLPRALLDAMNARLVRLTADLCSGLASRGESFGSCDPSTDAAWGAVRPAAAAVNVNACWHALIRNGGGDVMGAFCVFHASPDGPKAADEGAKIFMDKLTSLLAIAVEHRQLTEHLEHRAEHDALTGLPNRATFDQLLHAATAGVERSVGVLFIDVDRFKVINDTMGHLVGDLLLCELVERMQRAVGEAGTVARLGGDEFAIVLPRLADRADAVRVGLGILEEMRVPFLLGGHELAVTVSVGLSCFPHDGRDTVTLQKNADNAMYRAKHGGRNALQCFDRAMEQAVTDRLALEADLRHALARGELALHYQPQVDAGGGTVGAEALLRWEHPKRGMVPPATFIPLAEESGMILKIGAWVIERAARQLREWLDAGADPRTAAVAVNVSVVQFAQPDFVTFVEDVVRRYALPRGAFELELTESLLMKDPARAAHKLQLLRQAGVRLAIDDFGTGYSSLAYLRDLPVDSVKIDRSFVIPIVEARPVGAKPDANVAVVRAITSMAHSLGLSVVAEGVETAAQFEFLVGVECDRLQGYLFGRPARPGRLPAVVNSQMARLAG